MKDLIQIMAVFAVILTIIPTIVFLRPNESASKPAFAEKEKIAVYFTESGKTEDFTLEEYMIGSVLAQMPADFDEEALKAQAVLAHTYICRRQLSESQSPTPALKGALISDDSTLYQSFFTLKAAKEYYGSDYEKAYKKVKSAANAVKDDILTIKAERHTETEKKDKDSRSICCERSYGSYSRQFDVSGIDTDKISAKYENGVLKLTMPKKEAPKETSKHLEIE